MQPKSYGWVGQNKLLKYLVQNLHFVNKENVVLMGRYSCACVSVCGVQRGQTRGGFKFGGLRERSEEQRREGVNSSPFTYSNRRPKPAMCMSSFFSVFWHGLRWFLYKTQSECPSSHVWKLLSWFLTSTDGIYLRTAKQERVQWVKIPLFLAPSP